MDDTERWLHLKGYYFAGRNYERADLRNKDLSRINFSHSNFRGADFSNSVLDGCDFRGCDLSRACLHLCSAKGCDFSGADMTNCYCKAVNFTGSTLWHTCFKGALLKEVRFFNCTMVGADLARAECLGARFDGSNTEGVRNIDKAIFRWFLNPVFFGKPVYDPYPGAIVLTQSALGDISIQENAGFGQNKMDYILDAPVGEYDKHE